MSASSQPAPPRLFQFDLNAAPFSVTASPTTRLIHILRNDAALNGPKFGCGFGQCGACCILVDGRVARSCVLTLAAVEGRRVTTLEGLKEPGGPGLVQRAFIAGQGAQCGYCLNGMVITAHALLKHDPAVDRAIVARALKHNLCRCGTHAEIVDSVMQAAEAIAAGEAF